MVLTSSKALPECGPRPGLVLTQGGNVRRYILRQFCGGTVVESLVPQGVCYRPLGRRRSFSDYVGALYPNYK